MWKAILGLLLAQAQPDDEARYQKKTFIDFSDVTISGEMSMPSGSYLSSRMSAAPGGAQDIEHFREGASSGAVPYPGSITVEGLLRQHELPMSASIPCDRLLCPIVEAGEAHLASNAEVTQLVQIGFSSGIDLSSFTRAPLNLIVVVDRSGSMSGEKIDLVRRSLLTIASRSRPGDRMAIVGFADDATVMVEPTAASDPRIVRAIEELRADGSTNLEGGLALGFDLAAKTRRFDGTTRVMLFTDEQPNIGRTDAQSFRGMAENAGRTGVGLTTIGVGVDFHASLATSVSGVRGGNLYYFADPRRMATVLEEDFDLMVTELGYDLSLEIAPPRGLRVAGIYGVPETIVSRREETVRISVTTLFASKSRGAIFIALAGRSDEAGSVDLAFTEIGGRRRTSKHAFQLGATTLGLERGAALIDEAALLRIAVERFHHLKDAKGALAAVRTILPVLKAEDPELARERPMILELERTLLAMSPEAVELTARR